MPYIKHDQRPQIDFLVDQLAPLLKEPGKFNYAVSRLAKMVVDHEGRSYDCFNALVGVLECVKLELYRRMIAPYEDIKMEQNGDVYAEEHVVGSQPAIAFRDPIKMLGYDGRDFIVE